MPRLSISFIFLLACFEPAPPVLPGYSEAECRAVAPYTNPCPKTVVICCDAADDTDCEVGWADDTESCSEDGDRAFNHSDCDTISKEIISECASGDSGEEGDSGDAADTAAE